MRQAQAVLRYGTVFLPVAQNLTSVHGKSGPLILAVAASTKASPNMKRSAAASGPRAPKLRESDRREQLEKDDWITKVEPHRVLCAGCKKWKSLHPKTTYAYRNWEQHKMLCKHITGQETVRQGRPKLKDDTTVRALPSAVS